MKPPTLRVIATILLSFVLLGAEDSPQTSLTNLLGSDHPLECGSLASVKAIVFIGNATFTDAHLRHALMYDSVCQHAGHPRAPLAAWQSTIAERLTLGYQASGFPKPMVSASCENNQIVVRITEGSRFNVGAVKIVGNAAISSDRLIEEVTAPSCPDKSWWTKGKPAHFDPPYLDRMTQAVRKLYAAIGRLNVGLTITPITRSDGAADAVVHISNEGSVGVVDEIIYHGLQKTDQRALEKYAQIHVGMSLEHDPQVQMKLAASGRFRTQEMTLEPLPTTGHFRMVVTVTESICVPPIQTPLSEIDQALLRAHHWLTTCMQTGSEDIIVDNTVAIAGQRFDVRTILSPKRGLGVIADCHTSAHGNWRAALLSCDSTGVLASTRTGRGVKTVNVLPLLCTMSLGGRNLEKTDINPTHDVGTMSFQLGWQPRRSNVVKPPMATSFSLDANQVLNLAHAGVVQVTLEQGLLWCRYEGLALCCHADTGRLESFTYKLDADGLNRIEVHVAKDALSEALAATTIWGKDLDWTWDQRSPDGGACALLLGESDTILASLSSWKDFSAWRGGISIASMCSPAIAKFLAEEHQSASDNTFTIPDAPRANAANSLGEVGGLPLTFSAVMGRDISIESWPVMLMRNVGTALQGDTAYLLSDVQRAATEPQCGPLGYLVIGKMMDVINCHPQALWLGECGLSRCNEESWRCDWALLSPYASTITHALGNLTPDSAAWNLIPNTHRSSTQTIVERWYKQLKSWPTSKNALDVLGTRLWQAWVGDALRRELKNLAHPPKPPTATPSTPEM